VLIFSESDLDARSVALAESSADEVVLIPRRLSRARALVSARELDVLWYPDLGMDSFTLYLTHARLARAQVTTWGHPNTTGVPTVDAFLSLDALEPERATPPYTETLLCQSAPNIYYTPHRLAGRPTRQSVGLPSAGTLYGCPQTLFKMHPDFDRALCGILDRDPRAVLVLHEGRTRRWRALFTQRLEALHPGAGRRIHWLQGMPRQRYIETLAALDVMLDPFPFGGGNTTLEAFAVGTPVVTCPPSLARGRLAAAFYARLGWRGAIASDTADYVSRAVRLATDPSARSAAVAAIRSGSAQLFENQEGVRQFEGLLEQSLQLRHASCGSTRPRHP
jgi:predicted O-linked N-acetylglucosamine transferase (SPINDLY family)